MANDSLARARNIFTYLGLIIFSTLACGLIGTACGFGLGWIMSLGYQPRPGDPGHAPAYVALGLAFTGGGLGLVAGLAGGIVLCARKAGNNVQSTANGHEYDGL